MASERRLKSGVLACVAALMALSGAASVAWGSPRLVVLCGLCALPIAASLHSCLRRLSLAVPAPLAAPAVPSAGQTPDAALAFEARLEHAPVALFRIVPSSPASQVLAHNGNARRLLAPGRASDPDGLMRQLAALPVERRVLIHFETERGSERALVAVSALNLHGQPERLAALMPVESELEAEALQAWRRLVHVLTHEIMNSLTPVASLSRTAGDLLDELRPALPPEALADLSTALDAIARRSGSLADFVGSYRSLSNIPAPRPERVRVAELFARIEALLGADWRARGGRLEVMVAPASLELVADPGQLEQAILNLLRNASDATAGVAAPQAQLSARLARGGRLRIEVADNGAGVPDELIAQLFTPFFSTKAHGSGIGLAMVRQLVHANGGTVRYARAVGAGARFVIAF
ncbi:sensor histidine kinase [Massilia horti]|uniref:histidine kinase n=1 Tax=Massilia horti TaxID=2562153 RepID=A0A4Y9T8E5_9BURK|nr:ATP-binding protein [Massilia horti]TFW34108.1 ATP-binding protein [Massilia horti]